MRVWTVPLGMPLYLSGPICISGGDHPDVGGPPFALLPAVLLSDLHSIKMHIYPAGDRLSPTASSVAVRVVNQRQA